MIKNYHHSSRTNAINWNSKGKKKKVLEARIYYTLTNFFQWLSTRGTYEMIKIVDTNTKWLTSSKKKKKKYKMINTKIGRQKLSKGHVDQGIKIVDTYTKWFNTKIGKQKLSKGHVDQGIHHLGPRRFTCFYI